MDLRPVSFGCSPIVHAAYAVTKVERWRDCPKHVAYTVCGRENLFGGPVWDREGTPASCPVCAEVLPTPKPALIEFFGLTEPNPETEIAA